MVRSITRNEVKAVRGDRCGEFSTDEERVNIAKNNLPSEELTTSIAEAFKILSHPTRVRIIRALSSGELCVCEISEVLGMSVSATSHQLSLLRSSRLVRSRSEGKLVNYSLSDRFVLSLLDDCEKHLAKEGVA